MRRSVAVGRPVWVGIQGGTCAGKSFFASALSNQFGVEDTTIITLDDFFHPHDRRAIAADITAYNFDHPLALDWELLRDSVYKLDENDPVMIPSFNYDSGLRDKSKLVLSRKYIIIEGLWPFYSQPLVALLHIGVFIDTPADIRLSRLLFRNIIQGKREWTIQSLLAYYTQCARPMHMEFIEAGKGLANVVVDGEDSLEVGLAAVTNYLDLLRQR